MGAKCASTRDPSDCTCKCRSQVSTQISQHRGRAQPRALGGGRARDTEQQHLAAAPRLLRWFPREQSPTARYKTLSGRAAGPGQRGPPPGTPRRAALAGLCQIPAPHPQPHRAELSPGDQPTAGWTGPVLPHGRHWGGPWDRGFGGSSAHLTRVSTTARAQAAQPAALRCDRGPIQPCSPQHAFPTRTLLTPWPRVHADTPGPAGGNRRGSAGYWDQPLLGPARAPPAAPAPPARRYRPPQSVFLGRAQPEPEPAAPPSPGSP